MFSKTQSRKKYFYPAVACIAAFLAVLPIAFIGIPSGNDLYQHYHFALAYYDSIINGDWFPGWSGKENYGYGGIGIRFYPSIPYYVMAFARIVSGNWSDASWIAFAFFMVIGSLGIYFWTREFLGAKESAFAGAMYAYIPNHLLQLYNAFLYAEYSAAAFLPFCFLFITRICRRENRIDVLGLAFFFALLTLTHIPSTIVGSICFLVYTLFVIDRQVFLKTIFRLGCSVIIGLSLSAFYWLRVITEMPWLNHSSEKFSNGFYDFKNSFFPFFLDQPTEKYYAEGYLLADIFTFLTLFFFVPFVYFVFFKKSSNKELPGVQPLKATLWLGLFALFMTTRLSQPVWEFVPVLRRIQFPGRWMTVVACVCALSCGLGFSQLKLFVGNSKIVARWLCLIFLMVIFTLEFADGIHPVASAPYSREKMNEITSNLLEYESYDCWWTVWAKRKAFETTSKVLAGGRNANIVSWESEAKTFEVGAGEAITARIATFYYPHWRASVNGQSVAIEKDENGVILLRLPKESANVKLSFEEPFAVRIAEKLSLAAWLTFLLLCGILMAKKFIFAEPVLKTI